MLESEYFDIVTNHFCLNERYSLMGTWEIRLIYVIVPVFKTSTFYANPDYACDCLSRTYRKMFPEIV